MANSAITQLFLRDTEYLTIQVTYNVGLTEAPFTSRYLKLIGVGIFLNFGLRQH